MPWIVVGAFVLLYVIMGFRMVGMHSVMAKELEKRNQLARARDVRWVPVLWLSGLALCVGGKLAGSKPTGIVGGGVLVVAVVVQMRAGWPRRKRGVSPASAPATTANPEP